MSMLSRFETRLGLTRSDVTVALLVAGAALTGFVFTTFFDDRDRSEKIRHDLLFLERRHDSIAAHRTAARTASLDSSLARPDSIRAWEPLTAVDVARDSAARAAEPRPGSAKKSLPDAPVDLNTASREALMELPGIGEKTADAIIALRARSRFRRAEDLMNVKGIGQKKFEKIKQYIVVK